MTDFSLARRAMVESQLRPNGVTNAAVLEAMAAVPREEFVPAAARAFAYFDRSIPLDGGRQMMAPAALGLLLSALDPKPGERALVVAGAGGYAAAALRAVGLEVSEVEAGAKLNSPYDLILIDGAVEQLTPDFAKALTPDGRLGTALIDRGVTRLAIAVPAGGALAFRTLADASVPPIDAFCRPRVFTF